MRDSEIKHLQRGCITHKRDDDERIYRHLITSTAFKGEGTPTGVTATWVVSPPVERAVAVLEQLQPPDEPYLFNTLRGSSTYRTPGRAMTTTTTIRSINALRRLDQRLLRRTQPARRHTTGSWSTLETLHVAVPTHSLRLVPVLR